VTVFLALSPRTAASLGAVVLGEHVSSLAGVGLIAVVLAYG
jgi:threonine/homoserine efflux transporter RhtA